MPRLSPATSDPELEYELRRIFRRVRIRSASSFEMDGEKTTVAPSSDASIQELLAEKIYRHGFCSPFDDTPGDEPEEVLSETFLSELSAANAGRDRVVAGWSVVAELDSGKMLVRRAKRLQAVWPHLLLVADGRAPRVGGTAAIFLPREAIEPTDDYYWAFGEQLPDPRLGSGLVRLYWNLKPRGAAALVAALTTDLNRFRIPFQLKCLRRPESYARRDSAVLFVPRGIAGLVAEIALRVRAELADGLAPETPLFTRRLAPGLAVADEPGEQGSFGRSRCRALARAIWTAYDEGSQEDEARIDALRRELARRGWSLDRPHLDRDGDDSVPLLARADPPPSYRPGEPFAEEAYRIGARLCRDAVWADGECNWVGASLERVAGSWRVIRRSWDADLYDGTSGIALFLARLVGRTGDAVVARVCVGALRQALRRRAVIPPVRRPGLYSGWAGIVYALHQAGLLLGREDLLRSARDLTDELAAELPASPELDVLGGCAGGILALLACHRHDPAAGFSTLAARYGDRLVAAARRCDEGLYWRELIDDASGERLGLCGYAHGAAGIASALLELHAVTGEDRYRRVAEDGFRYESSLFDAEHGGWPDLRAVATGAVAAGKAPRFRPGWCRGASGGGMARLRAWRLSRAEIHRREGVAALRSACREIQGVRRPAARDYSLCHGLAGVADFAVLGSEVLGDDLYLAAARQAFARGLLFFGEQESHWPSGVQGGEETQGLMLGDAGIGHLLLRLDRPSEVPSICLVSR